MSVHDVSIDVETREVPAPPDGSELWVYRETTGIVSFSCEPCGVSLRGSRDEVKSVIRQHLPAAPTGGTMPPYRPDPDAIPAILSPGGVLDDEAPRRLR